MKSIAIMQPTFLPWLGYFDLIDQVDDFVFLDTVEFSKQSWQQRNKIKTTTGSAWISLPAQYSKTMKTTLSETLVGDLKLFKKSIRTLQHAYAKAKLSSVNLEWIVTWLSGIEQGQQLSTLNIDFIDSVCRKLSINTPKYLSSQLASNNNRHQRLIDICLHFNATKYVSPPGAFTYLQEDVNYFKEAGIEVVFHDYNHPVYNQLHGDFISHMSIIDLILNEGDRALSIIREGRMAVKSYDDF